MQVVAVMLSISLVIFSACTRAASSAADFFQQPDMTHAKLSPNGAYVAAIRNLDGKQTLVLINTETAAQQVLLDLQELDTEDAQLNDIQWIGNTQIATQFLQSRQGVKDLLDTQSISSVLVISLPTSESEPATVRRFRTQGWIAAPMPEQENTLLYATSGLYSKLYTIDTRLLHTHSQRLSKLMKKDGGQFTKKNEVASVSGHAVRWFVDASANPLAVLNYKTANEIELNAIDEKGSTQLLASWKEDELMDRGETAEKKLIPIALADGKHSFYCLDLNEDERRTLYKVNFTDKREEVVFESASHKIVDLLINPTDGSLTGVKIIKNALLRTVYLGENKGVEIETDTLVATVGESKDKKVTLKYLEAHNRPGQFYLESAKRKQVIGQIFSSLPATFNAMQEQRYIDVEGLPIPYLLNYPKSATSSPAPQALPLIVMPHGGPIGVYDSAYFDLVTQFFVANGYAVLRVNFRGSSGHTKALRDAGTKQWGDLMLTDIYRATKEAIDDPKINAQHVCLFGASYGGYATTSLLIQHPDLYRCGVSVAGVMDLNLYVNASGRSTQQDLWLQKHLGHFDNDYSKLMAMSPLYQVENLTRPLFILHGDKDEVVDIEHAYRLKFMLDKYNKPYRWQVLDDTGHDFGDADDMALLLQSVVDFIDENISAELDPNSAS